MRAVKRLVVRSVETCCTVWGDNGRNYTVKLVYLFVCISKERGTQGAAKAATTSQTSQLPRTEAHVTGAKKLKAAADCVDSNRVSSAARWLGRIESPR